ncbi:MAG: transcriptional regulator [Geminicoccaceae bacterium]|nr:transcriptional regulator [Geminicoccaceae bacterium]
MQLHRMVLFGDPLLTLAHAMTRGLVLGKFLPYHAGHAHLIRTARAAVDELIVLVCSIEREPIPGALRFGWVRDAHPDCRVVHVPEEVPQAPEDDPEFWAIWTDLISRYAGQVDRVFTSEAYGDELARRIGAQHVCVDPDRRTVPISATELRRAPLRYWEYIPGPVRPYYARRIALLGTESTGKTTIAERLAERFDTVWVREYGREYCETRPALGLTLPDFEAIAWGQATLEDEAALDANRVLICDTELHTTATWSDLVIGTRPAWLTAAARARHYDLVLLFDHDLPWVADGTRVLSNRRPEHTQRLRDELEAAGRRYTMLSGSYANREREAARLVSALLRADGVDMGAVASLAR